jgi:hypothetical protein
MKKIISLVMIFVLLLGVVVYAGQYETLVPEANKINEKKHFNEFSKMTSENQLNEYLENLDTKEAFSMIAECAEEFDKSGEYTQMVVFADYVNNNLIGELKEADYINVLGNPEYSRAFKICMIDIYTSSRNEGMSIKEFDEIMRRIIKDKNEDLSLRFYALATMKNMDSNDIEMLMNIINSEGASDGLKVTSLKQLSRIDKNAVYPIVKNIVKKSDQYSIEEVKMAMSILSRITNELNVQNEESIINDINDIAYIIENSNDASVLRSATRSLGNIENKNTMKVVIKQRDKINNEGVIAYFVDKSYFTIEKMLDLSNDTDSIKLAFEYVDIAPYKSFASKLKVISENHEDLEIRNQAMVLIEKINANSYERNNRWDG